MDERTRGWLQGFVRGDLSLERLEMQLKHACDYGEREGPAKEVWARIDELMGSASLERRAISPEEQEQVRQTVRGMLGS